MLSIWVLLAGVALLLVMITLVKLNTFASLILTALLIGWANGLPTVQLMAAVTKGIGDILGSVIMVLAFGVMLGSILVETGATRQISDRLIRSFGVKRTRLAVAVTSFCVGLALFYNAGFVVLIPLVFAIAHQTRLPLVYLAIAMAAPLSVTHGFLPPHPGPVTVAAVFGADIGKTLLYGLAVAAPVLVIAAYFFPEFIKNTRANPPAGIFNATPLVSEARAPLLLSLLVALTPVLLLIISSVAKGCAPGGPLTGLWQFIGDPAMSLLLAILAALFLLGVPAGIKISTLMDKSGSALQAITAIILITAAGGALKQVLLATGTSDAIAHYFQQTDLPPLLLGWLVATVMRIAIGSATVAALTAAGIVQPLMTAMQVSPELMVLAIGAGSLMCSHVNDTGFWMFKEYLGLSLKDTFKTWTVMETLIGILGLVGVLLLNAIL